MTDTEIDAEFAARKLTRFDWLKEHARRELERLRREQEAKRAPE